jgi:hypothetical protein
MLCSVPCSKIDCQAGLSSASSTKKAISYYGLCGDEERAANTAQRAPLSKQRNKRLQTTLIEAAAPWPRNAKGQRPSRDRVMPVSTRELRLDGDPCKNVFALHGPNEVIRSRCNGGDCYSERNCPFDW